MNPGELPPASPVAELEVVIVIAPDVRSKFMIALPEARAETAFSKSRMYTHVNSQDVDLNGITIMGDVTASPASIVKRFGEPSSGEGYKISGEYAFTNERGEAFVLHDWMCTSLYTESAPAPETFWAIGDPVTLSVSSLDLDISDFATWLQSELAQ